MACLVFGGNHDYRNRLIMSEETDNQESPRKRVQFDDAPQVIVNPATLSEQECSASWWSSIDFAIVKDTVKKQCRDHRRSRRYSDCLTEAYRSACHMAVAEGLEVPDLGPVPNEVSTIWTDSSICSCIVITNSSCLSLQGLIRWLEDEGPRGLEGYSSRMHAVRRQRHLQDTKHAVFVEQARQNITNERNDELLAHQASNASRRARTFATLLGRADAWAANDTDDQKPPPPTAVELSETSGSEGGGSDDNSGEPPQKRRCI